MLGIVIGLVVAGIPAAIFFDQVNSLKGQNIALARKLADDMNHLANDTNAISNLELEIGNLSSELRALHSVVNFSVARVEWGGNLTVAMNRAYGYGLGAPDATMSKPGYVGVVFQAGVANSSATSVQAHLEVRFINKSVNWGAQTQPQLVLLTFIPPMGGNVNFVNDGTSTIWVNYQILYLT